jgi:hypothetical protein
MSDKKATIFDHLSYITDKKVVWDTLSDADKKTFTPYMINKWLSMNMDFVEIVNELQKYTIGQLSAAETYKLYFDILPKQKQYNKYIKGKKADKFNSELVELISNHFLVSEKEAKEYIEMYLEQNITELKDIVKMYGKNEKEIEKLFKIEK